MKNYRLREIVKEDNKAIEGVIRSCLIEFHANHEGTAWSDPDLGRFSEIYNSKECKYWIAEDLNGKVVAGVGIGQLVGVSDTCELQKMYCLPEARGTGISHELIKEALEFAKQYYKHVYLETFKNMIAAQKFYEKYGFYRLKKSLGETGHYACDVCYMKDF
ncbi:acetyltransferase [Lachnospiraceae bacterium TWA4]|nr:acetyltransferase [Lachnospiraceae bacterium TWA4]